MTRPSSPVITLIILLSFVIITNVDCRASGHGRGRAGRFRISNIVKNRHHYNNINRQSSILHKSNNRNLIRGTVTGGATILVGSLALRSYVSNYKKISNQSDLILTNGTGNVCVNRENISNFVFNEFHCPLSPIFTTNDRYCCGSFQQQYCCSFWESHRQVTGTVIGIIAACSLLLVFIICFIIYYRRQIKQKVLVILSLVEGKGFSSSRGGGIKGSKGSGVFGGSSSNIRPNNYNTMNKPSSFRKNAMGFAAGAAGGIAAYSIMRSMSGSYRSRPGGYYEPGYGGGDTCVNNEDMNGTSFGSFRCPLNGFPYEAKYCCGEYGKQYCCVREKNRFLRNSAHFGWIVLILVVLFIVILLVARRRRQRQKEMMMIPTEPPMHEQNKPPPFYHPPPPPMGYPAPPQYPAANPYAVPPQNYSENFNPYAQQSHMPYPPQQQPYHSQ
ncbi:unnamed protein product [Adineta steineri]|uniref:Shisa N-terminal domain-containing protein n=1 Tax=Adineta steineri TaxID=433720 RepID=A0A814C4J7_9BILA|nr:unnamed protein product [Adineta steineri]CAF1362616.1 unnamed protein product [Adineta steineri]